MCTCTYIYTYILTHACFLSHTLDSFHTHLFPFTHECILCHTTCVPYPPPPPHIRCWWNPYEENTVWLVIIWLRAARRIAVSTLFATLCVQVGVLILVYMCALVLNGGGGGGDDGSCTWSTFAVGNNVSVKHGQTWMVNNTTNTPQINEFVPVRDFYPWWLARLRRMCCGAHYTSKPLGTTHHHILQHAGYSVSQTSCMCGGVVVVVDVHEGA